MKEASQPVERRILKLKREMKSLMDRRRFLDGSTAGKEEPEPQQATAREKRKKVVVQRRRVPRQLIDYMIENPHDPWNGYPQEQLVKRSQKFQEYYAREKAFSDKVLEHEQALIKQYRHNGFAEDYTEVPDNDEEKN